VRAAEVLGISPKTLYNRLTEYRDARKIGSDDIEADATGKADA